MALIKFGQLGRSNETYKGFKPLVLSCTLIKFKNKTMKKIFTTFLIAIFAITLTAQITGYNHYQSYGTSQKWNHKEGNNFTVIASNKYYKETAVFQFDLKNLNATILNDSITKSLTYSILGGDSGYAIDPAFTGKSYYTYDNWKTINENTTSAPKLTNVTKTSTGFVGYKSPDLFYSKDLINWTQSTTMYNNVLMTETQGRLTVFNDDKYFHISTDGGQTFTVRQNNFNQSSYFSELGLMLDTATILAKNGNNWYFTKNSGKNWTKTINNSNHKLFYAERLDSLYGTTPSRLDSLYVSTDTGKTWQSIAKIPLALNGKRVQKHGDYFVETSSVTYSKSLTQGWVRLPTAIQGSTCISMKGNYGIIGGSTGIYSYTQNGGKTFENGKILNADNLVACKVINDTLMLFSDAYSNTYLSKDGGVTWYKGYGNSLRTSGKKFTHSADLSTIIQLRAGQNLISRNQGISWSQLGSLGGSYDGSVTPLGKFFIILGDKILDMSTTNGSTTTVNTITEPNIKGVNIEMIDENNGYVIVENTTDTTTVIFRTKDGWTTYTKAGTIKSLLTQRRNPFVPSIIVPMSLGFNVIAPDTLYINKFSVADEELSSNVIHKSFDGGASWTADTIIPSKVLGSDDNLQAMHFYNGTQFISIWDEGRVFLNKGLNGSPVIINPNKVKTFNSLNKNTVYPNPTSGIIYLKQTEGVQQINVYTVTGKIIKTFVNIDFNDGVQIQELPQGMYILQIVSNQGSSTTKIIKE